MATLELEARIGSVEDPDLGLTRVGEVMFGADELLYVTENSERQIRVYNVSGNLLRRIGREGEGPGEFRSIGSMGFMEDTLFVTDGSLRRFNMFTADGEFIASFPWVSRAPDVFTPPVFSMATTPEVILPDGSGALQQGYGYVAGEVVELHVPWLHIDRAGETLDTIVVQHMQLGNREVLHENGEQFPVSPPIRDQALYQFAADRSGTIVVVERPVATAATIHSFRVLKLAATGDTVFSRNYEYTPVATSPDEAERQATLIVDRYSSRPSAPSAEGLTRIFAEDGFIPTYWPPVSAIRTGQDGTVWLQREVTGADSVTWIRISDDGAVQGGVRLAERGRIMAARENLIAVLELDELDVPYLSVFRIVHDDE